MNIIESLRYFIPESVLTAGAFIVLFLDLFLKNKKWVGAAALIVLAVSAGVSSMPQDSYSLFNGFFHLDPFTHFFRLAALGIAAVTILVSSSYRSLGKNEEGEYYSLLLFMALGLILMAASSNLLMIFLSIEFVSILSYLLVGFLKKDPRAKEAAVKYLLFGSLVSGIMLYGISLLFGISGSLDLETVGGNIAASRGLFMPGLIGLVFFLAGLGFKISMAPFHLWAPDVYESAPTPISGFLTVGPKALGFAVLIRVLGTGFPFYNVKWMPLMIFFSILTMTLGNVVAISQTNIKRLLAYSSIAQAGYMLMGICTFNETGLTGVLIYLIAYALTNLGAFTVVIAASNHFGDDAIDSYAGLARRSPFLAASLTLLLLSLAGLPPLGGFIGKFFMFSAAIESKLYTLAVIAAVNSAVAAFYYFRIVRLMYLTPPTHREEVHQGPSLTFAVILLVAATLALGLIPSPVISFVKTVLLV